MRSRLAFGVLLGPTISACSENEPKYSPRYLKLEDIIINSPDHDGVPITETTYQFGPTKVTFDDMKWRLQINDKDYGPVKAGDEVKLGSEITVNGEVRKPAS